MDLGLKGKIALVTGAGSQTGFGKGIVMALAKEGCHIMAVDIDLKGAKQTAAEVKALGCQAVAIKADITQSAAVNGMIKTALDEFGRIDILVNNAGGATPPRLFIETTEERWDTDINLNLKGAMNCSRAVLPQMIERKNGKIVNISSTAGIYGVATGTGYSVAKAGVILFTRTLALEVTELGIRVNCIAPAPGNTGFYNDFDSETRRQMKAAEIAGKTVTPQDIGNTVAFLVSDVSERIVGQCIVVSGTASL